MPRGTLILYWEGTRYVFKGDQVDTVLQIAIDSDGVEEAWSRAADYGEAIRAVRGTYRED